MQCLRCVVEREHRKPFLQLFCLFPTVLYYNCVKLKYAPCVVSSSCPNDLMCVKTTGTRRKNRKGQWICPSLVKSGINVGSGSLSRRLPCPAPSVLNSIRLSPWKAATGSAGKLEAAFRCFPLKSNPTLRWAVALSPLRPPVEETGLLKHTKLLQRK